MEDITPTPEQIAAIVRCIDFVDHAAGEGLEIEGVDAAELWTEVATAVGHEPFTFGDLGQAVRKILEKRYVLL